MLLPKTSLYLGEEDFVTSDLHLNDAGIVKRRYASGVDSMMEHMASVWDRRVPAEATVLVLGDVFTVGKTAAFEWLRHRTGAKILVPGNWDKPDESWVVENGGPFLNIYQQLSVAFAGGMTAHVSHYDYLAPHRKPDDYPRPIDTGGEVLLHGHTHSPKRLRLTEKGSLQVHVGWEAWRAPVKVGDLVQWISKEEASPWRA